MKTLKHYTIAIMLFGIFLFPMGIQAQSYSVPDDVATTEALIDLHKTIKKDEDEALKRITTSTSIQDIITKGTDKVKATREVIDSKVNNAYSYVILASSLSTTANSLYKLTMEYKDFSTNTFRYVSKKPFVAWYYVNANTAIAREIKHCTQLYGIVAASGMNVWRASMDEKLNLIFTLKNSIDRARNIIYNANLYCYLIVNTSWRPDYIWEILTSDVKDAIMEGIIKDWKSNI